MHPPTSNSRFILLWLLRPILLLFSLTTTLTSIQALSSSSSSSSMFSTPQQHPPLRAIFSDIDGTLVHYAKDFTKHGVRLVSSDPTTLTAVVERDTTEPTTGITTVQRCRCRLLPSSTMGPACISERTIALVDELRAKGVLFAVVTAARKSTLADRWGLLPECDVRVCESGSRIYVGGGRDEASAEEIDARLDTEFASRFEDVCGPMDREHVGADVRDEPLWRFYRRLRSELPSVKLDARSYYGMFRASCPADTEGALQKTIEDALPRGISCSTNLGKYDFYPTAAGKGNAVRYLRKKFGGIKLGEAACLFDDDNDLPMANECGIHMLPGLTSDSVREAAGRNLGWEVAESVGQGVFAVEECLERLLERMELERGSRQKEEELKGILGETLFASEEKKNTETAGTVTV